MASFKVPLKIDQGATFQKVVTWKSGNPAAPVDLTGCTARAQIRTTVTSPDVLHEMTSSPGGGITIDDVLGEVTIDIDAATTAGFTWKTAVYDLEIVFAGGNVRRLLHGPVSVSPEVTRD